MKRFISTPENMEITDALMTKLRGLGVGDVAPNEHINNLAKDKRHLITKARRAIEKEQGCILATVIGVGIKKMDPGSAQTIGKDARVKAFRGTRRARDRIVGVIRAGSANMDRQTKLKLSSEVNKLGFIAEMCMDDE